MFFISIVCLAGFAEAQNYIGAGICLAVMGIETYKANKDVDNTATDWQTVMLEWIFSKKKGLGNGNSSKPTHNKQPMTIITHNDRKGNRVNAYCSKSKAI